MDLLSRMMHPDPAERPSVDQVLAERSVRWEALRTNLTCVCRVVTTGVMSVVRGVLALVTLILAIFSGKYLCVIIIITRLPPRKVLES